jgi:hypothetical protein
MKRLTLFLTACVLAVLAVLVTGIRAQETNTNERTFITFNNTVELPGVTLPAGTYEFRLAPMSDSRNVVQVLKKDDAKVMGQWTFVPAQRDRVTNDTLIMFKESPEGTMPAVQYWYFPGEKVGKEFIYPKDQAQRIAARTGQAVRTDEGHVTASSASVSSEPASISASSNASRSESPSDRSLASGAIPAQPSAPAGSLTGTRGVPQADASASVSTDNAPSQSASADTSLRTAPLPAQPSAPAGSLTGTRGVAGTSGSSSAEPARDDARASQNERAVGTSGVAQAPAAQPAASELPKTASPLPLSGLIGVLSLVAALGVRSIRA